MTSFFWTVKAQQQSNAHSYPITGKYRIENQDLSDVFESNFYEIAQDDHGVMYVGTEEQGILINEGNKWVQFQLLSSTSALNIKNDLLYFGTNNNFGLIRVVGNNQMPKTGDLLMQSSKKEKVFNQFWRSTQETTFLLELLPKKNQPIGRIQQIFSSSDGAIFITSTHIIQYSKGKGTVEVLVQNSKGVAATSVDNRIFIWEADQGIFEIGKNKSEVLIKSEDLSHLSIQRIHALDPGKLLISTKNNGLILLENNRLHSFSTPYNRYYQKEEVTNMKLLNDGSVAIGTKSKGVFIIKQQGEILEIFDKSYGLIGNEVNNLFVDNSGWLWVSTTSGISKIEYPSPISYFDEANNLKGSVYALAEHKQNIYVATSEGLFFMPLKIYKSSLRVNSKPPKRIFQKTNNISGPCWSLCNVDETLLVASSEGTFQEYENGFKKISTDSTYSLYRSRSNPSRVYAGLNNGLVFFQKNNDSWKKQERIPSVYGKINRIVEDQAQRLWLGTDNGCWKISLSNPQQNPPKHFSKLQNQKLTTGEIEFYYFGKLNPLLVDGKPVFQNGGWWFYNAQKDSIFKEENHDYTPNFFKKLNSPFSSFSNSGVNYFSSFGKLNNRDPVFLRSANPTAIITNQDLDTLVTKDGRPEWSKEIRREGGFDIAYYTSDSLLFYYSSNRLFIHNGHPKGKDLFSPYRIYIKDIRNGKSRHEYIPMIDSSFSSVYLPESHSFQSVFPYTNNAFRFEFVSIGSPISKSNSYIYTLLKKGESANYRTGGTDNFCLLNNLQEGDYLFKVMASYNYGLLNYYSDEVTFEFTIKPPWYRTFWAYAVYVVLTLLFLNKIYKYLISRELEKVEASRLKDLDMLKTKLYTNLTHEFRTPLTVILGMADQIKEKPDAWLSKGLHLIQRNGKQLLHLVNQLLDLSKLESGAMEVNVIQGDIIPFLKYILESFHSLAESKDIKLHFLSDIESLQMDYDPEKMISIISNLISNAIKFTPEGEDVYLQISISLSSRKTSDKKILFLKVKDTGIGIAEEKLPHIFDRFYQIDETHKRSGSGIGLAIIQELTHLMDGKIDVKSNLGKGTEFIIELPIRNHGQLEEDSSHKKLQKDLNENLIIEGSKVVLDSAISSGENLDKPIALIVEDNQDVVTYLHSCLVNKYHIEIAYDGVEGIEKAVEVLPDIIICDVMMPYKDGFEVCAHLKNDNRTSHIPIILLTAKADLASKIEGLEKGADAYLAKPFNKEELVVRIDQLIALRQKLKKRYEGFNYLSLPMDKSFSHEDAFITKLIKVIDDHLSESDFRLPHFYRALGLSKAQFFRKVKSLTGQSPSLFIRAHRLHRGRELLHSTDLTISEIAYDVGFKEVSTFSRYFKETFGTTPSETRK